MKAALRKLADEAEAVSARVKAIKGRRDELLEAALATQEEWRQLLADEEEEAKAAAQRAAAEAEVKAAKAAAAKAAKHAAAAEKAELAAAEEAAVQARIAAKRNALALRVP